MKNYLKISIISHIIFFAMLFLLDYIFSRQVVPEKIQIVLVPPSATLSRKENSTHITAPKLKKTEQKTEQNPVSQEEIIQNIVNDTVSAVSKKTPKLIAKPLVNPEVVVSDTQQKTELQKKVDPVESKSTEQSKKPIQDNDILNNLIKDNIVTKKTQQNNPKPLTADKKLTKVDPVESKPIEEPLKEEPKTETVVEKSTKETESLEEQTVETNPPAQKQLFKKNKSLLSVLNKKDIPTLVPDKQPNNMLDILESNEITSEDKQSLVAQLSKCWISLIEVRDKDVTIKLRLKMNQDSSIDKIDILSISEELTDTQRQQLDSKILRVFKMPDCSKLILPEGKYSFWNEFNITLTLKSFFN